MYVFLGFFIGFMLFLLALLWISRNREEEYTDPVTEYEDKIIPLEYKLKTAFFEAKQNKATCLLEINDIYKNQLELMLSICSQSVFLL